MGGVTSKKKGGKNGGILKKAKKAKNRATFKNCLIRLPDNKTMQTASRIVYGDIFNNYEFEEIVLGRGFSGVVYLARRKDNSKLYAVKKFNKLRVGSEKLTIFQNEINVYLQLDHPNIARLIEAYEDRNHVYLVMENCSGGELYTKLRKIRKFPEAEAVSNTRHMLRALQYLHAHNVVHRDLKLENWLYETEEKGAEIKLIDFGFSRFWDPKISNKMRMTCGTLSYVSPDTLSGNYTNKCDMWSLGVIVYMLLSGQSPFFGDEQQIIKKINSGTLAFPDKKWTTVSQTAIDFLRRLLVVDPFKRISALEALHHPWIATEAPQSPIVIDRSVLVLMKQFPKETRLKRAALTMMAYLLTSDQMKGMKEQFLAFDKSDEGTIRIHELTAAMESEISAAEIESIFASMDSSGDKQIYYTDFVAAMLQARVSEDEDLIKCAFAKFDADGSGSISSENLKAVLGATHNGASIEEIIREAGCLQSGALKYETFLSMVRQERGAEDSKKIEDKTACDCNPESAPELV